MPLQSKIESDFKVAFKSGDALRRSVLGMLKTSIVNKTIEKKQKDIPLADTDVESLISIEVKRRKDSIIQYRAGNREDLANQEEAELKILMEYLPEQLSPEEIEKMVVSAIKQTGAQNEKDFGKVMGILSKETKGRADGTYVSKIVKEKLTQ